MPEFHAFKLICLLGLATPSFAAAQSETPAQATATSQNLVNIQPRIEQARWAASTQGDATELSAIAAELQAMNRNPSGQLAYYVPYWLAYTDYWLANISLKAGEKPAAAAALGEAYSLLTETPSPDVETYALMSLVAGLKIAVTTPDQIGDAIGHARDAMEQAVALDPDNPRVLYARALADYTTPKEYGGGRVAEKIARSAIEQSPEPARALRPTWGRDASAALLVRILRAADRGDEADDIYARSIAEYPNSTALRLLAKTP